MAISKKKRTSKPKTRRGSKKPKRMTKRTSRKPVVAKRPVKQLAQPPAPPATGPIYFDDEDAVLAEMARELDIDPDQLTIRETSPPTGVGDSKTYEITSGSKEWFVVENDDAAQELALAAVKNDLENEPELFNQSFIESHIDIERLRRDLHSDVEESNLDYAREAGADRFWEEASRWGIDVPDEDEDGARRDPTEEEIETFAEAMTEEQLKDPMQYLEDIYGKEDAVKQAIKIAGIDINAAAEQAIRDDGAGHFLSSYDGQLNETKRGLTYWRHN